MTEAANPDPFVVRMRWVFSCSEVAMDSVTQIALGAAIGQLVLGPEARMEGGSGGRHLRNSPGP